MPGRIDEYETLLSANPIWMRRTQDVAYLDLTSAVALGVTGPCLRAAGLPWDLRKTAAVLRLRDLRLRRAHPHRRRRLRPVQAADGRDAPVAADHRAGAGPARAGSGDGGRQEDRLAEPARARRRRPGQLPRPHPADHGHLDGVPDPPLQARHRGLPGPGRARSTARSSPPAASSARTWSPTAPPGRTGCTSATRPSSTCRPCPRCARAACSPTSSPRSPRSTRSWAGSTGDPSPCRSTPAPRGRTALMALTEQTRVKAREIIARYPRSRSALLPMLHLVQGEEGYVSPAGVALCAEELGLTKAEVGAVATFYTMYKRRPCGEFLVSVCTNLSCQILGGEEVYATLVGAPRGRPRPDHRGRPDHLRARRVPGRLRLRPGDDGELRVLRQRHPGVRARARQGAAGGRASAARPAATTWCPSPRSATSSPASATPTPGSPPPGRPRPVADAGGLTCRSPRSSPAAGTSRSPWTLATYERTDGYTALRKALDDGAGRDHRSWSRTPACAAAAAPASPPA